MISEISRRQSPKNGGSATANVGSKPGTRNMTLEEAKNVLLHEFNDAIAVMNAFKLLGEKTSINA